MLYVPHGIMLSYIMGLFILGRIDCCPNREVVTRS
jgi:hypothetical protein